MCQLCNLSGFCSCVAANVQVREYQKKFVEKALFTNTLVALPTGLGKTFIAAVVMYNYFRWFPEGNFLYHAGTFFLFCCKLGKTLSDSWSSYLVNLKK
ncbi:Os11g0180500 [Oryza sativa Japonica Group]|uniref:Os11g0180500 protein n=1 Tax=Oryza sativa subsp. japonica TaxID=39947 RepID=C7J8F2_ORYSJ|nr:Os11g0180500 [Oryza sativa Japonica Group]|eukprot:NP_001176388.1 Os11g0180500 [Oryza sativa Japonica Group]